jgi:uncharacterized membrane protein YfcA
MYPDYSPSVITSITLTVAFFNALSGSIAYFRLKRVDIKSGLLFAVTAVPGAIVGAYLINYLNREVFQYVFGSILLLVSFYILLRPGKKITGGLLQMWQTNRHITDRQNTTYDYSYNLPLGMFIAFFVGVVAGLLGIGGGIIHVPILTQILSFPAHIATATSHFIVAITTFSAIDTHLINRTFASDFEVALVLSAGAVVGAQFGALISHKVSGTLIIRLLALGLIIVALRLLISPI